LVVWLTTAGKWSEHVHGVPETDKAWSHSRVLVIGHLDAIRSAHSHLPVQHM
jgi:hypothetical protein